MHTIAVLNQKGGVGKTTTAVNLSAALARHGYRVGLIDLDPQAHASLHLGIDNQAEGPTMYDVLVEKAPLTDLWQQAEPGLVVARSHIDLAAAEVELASVADREMRLRAALEPYQEDDNFNYIVLDCPPSLGLLTLNALCGVKEVLLPLQPHFLALDGVGKLLETIRAVATRFNPGLGLTGILLCLYESGTRLAAEISGDVGGFLEQSREMDVPWSQAKLFEARIRRNIRLAEAPSHGQSIFAYAADCAGAVDYRAFAAELVSLHRRLSLPAPKVA